jgi:hypothetical protein
MSMCTPDVSGIPASRQRLSRSIRATLSTASLLLRRSLLFAGGASDTAIRCVLTGSPLRDPAVFEQVKIDERTGTITWVT